MLVFQRVVMLEKMRQGSHWINLFCTVVVFTEAGWLKKTRSGKRIKYTLNLQALLAHPGNPKRSLENVLFLSLHSSTSTLYGKKSACAEESCICVIHIRLYPFNWISLSNLTVHCYNIPQPPQHGLTIWRLFKTTQLHLMSHGEIFPNFVEWIFQKVKVTLLLYMFCFLIGFPLTDFMNVSFQTSGPTKLMHIN